MGAPFKNRMLTVSVALAASGIMTCGVALSDIFLPRGSAVLVLASIPLLGGIVLGVLIAFAWTCEWLDRRGWLRAAGLKARTKCNPAQVVSTRSPNLDSSPERQPAPKTSSPLRPLIDYPLNLRGRMPFPGNRRVSG